MILDTGASGFVITKAAAVALGLGSFGELYAASISGKVRVCMCVFVFLCCKESGMLGLGSFGELYAASIPGKVCVYICVCAKRKVTCLLLSCVCKLAAMPARDLCLLFLMLTLLSPPSCTYCNLVHLLN